MGNKNYTTTCIHKDLREILLSLRMNERETLQQVVWRLAEDEKNRKEQMKQDINKKEDRYVLL